MSAKWAFEDTPDTAVITIKRVLSRQASVLLVMRETEWQFLDGEDVQEQDAAVVGLGQMLLLDPSLAGLAALPQDWQAWRETSTSPWRMEPIT